MSVNKSYTCQDCGHTRQYNSVRRQGPPTHCRNCRPSTRPAAVHTSRMKLPKLLAEFGLCGQVGDVDIFYPEKGGSSNGAKRVCAACPVRNECLQFALNNNEEFGIWGGMTADGRRRLLSRNNAA